MSQSESIQPWRGYLLASLFFFSSLLQSLLNQNGLHEIIKVSVRWRAGIIDVVYRKTLTLSASAASSTTSPIPMSGTTTSNPAASTTPTTSTTEKGGAKGDPGAGGGGAAAGGGVGDIVNILAIDLERLQFVWMIWGTPLNILIALTLLYAQLGWTVFVGLGVIVLSFIFNGVLASRLELLQVFFF